MPGGADNALLWYPMIRQIFQLPAVFSCRSNPGRWAMGNAHTQRFLEGNLEFSFVLEAVVAAAAGDVAAGDVAPSDVAYTLTEVH